MELFLNSVWLLLFVPAWWLWRRNGRNFSSLRCFLTLACALVILFPVISATDDLHAAPQAMEESSSTKRALKHNHSGKAQHPWYTPPAQINLGVVASPASNVCARVQDAAIPFPKREAGSGAGERSPPALTLS